MRQKCCGRQKSSLLRELVVLELRVRQKAWLAPDPNTGLLRCGRWNFFPYRFWIWGSIKFNGKGDVPNGPHEYESATKLADFATVQSLDRDMNGI